MGVADYSFLIMRTVQFSKLKLLSSSFFIILRLLTVRSSFYQQKEKKARPLCVLCFLRGEKKISGSSVRDRQLVEAWERGVCWERRGMGLRALASALSMAWMRVRSLKVRWVERIIEDMDWQTWSSLGCGIGILANSQAQVLRLHTTSPTSLRKSEKYCTISAAEGRNIQIQYQPIPRTNMDMEHIQMVQDVRGQYQKQVSFSHALASPSHPVTLCSMRCTSGFILIDQEWLEWKLQQRDLYLLGDNLSSFSLFMQFSTTFMVDLF